MLYHFGCFQLKTFQLKTLQFRVASYWPFQLHAYPTYTNSQKWYNSGRQNCNRVCIIFVRALFCVSALFFVCALFFVRALFCVFELLGAFVIPWNCPKVDICGSEFYDVRPRDQFCMIVKCENTCHRCEIHRNCEDSCQRCESLCWRCEKSCCEFPGNLNLAFDLELTLNLTGISRVL